MVVDSIPTRGSRYIIKYFYELAPVTTRFLQLNLQCFAKFGGMSKMDFHFYPAICGIQRETNTKYIIWNSQIYLFKDIAHRTSLIIVIYVLFHLSTT